MRASAALHALALKTYLAAAADNDYLAMLIAMGVAHALENKRKGN